MKINGDQLMIKPMREALLKYGSIFMPETATKRMLIWGEVIGTGKGHRGYKTGNLWPMMVKPGDIVLFPRGSEKGLVQDITFEGVRYYELIFLDERDACLIIRDGEMLPVYNCIIGKVLVDETIYDVSEAGILIPKPKDSIRFVKVKVEKVGPGGRSDDGTLIPCTAAIGDIAIIESYNAWEYQLGEDVKEGFVVMDEGLILALEDPSLPLTRVS